MKFCVVQAQAQSFLVVRSVGRFHGPHMKSLMSAIANLDAYRDAQILHDMRLVDFNVPLEEIVEVARNHPDQPRNGRLAVVAATGLGFGMLRVIASIRENTGRKVHAFQDIADALEWLSVPGFEAGLPDTVEAVLTEHVGLSEQDPSLFGITIKCVNQGARA